jgi:RNA polymerase sigma-70 factor (ECF subfamily)
MQIMPWKSRYPEADALIAQARQGMRESLGRLLQTYTNYVKLVAAAQVGARLKVRVSPSDVVQETFLQAHRTFDQFRGQTEAEFFAWLQRILTSQLTHLYEKHVLAQKRDVRREVSLDEVGAKLDRSTARLASVLADDAPSPGSVAQQHERAVILADELADLPPDYRDVLLWRNLEGLSFEEVAEHMQRSPGAVRMLWLRAVDKLRQQLTDKELI